MLRTKKREERERKDKARRDSLQAAIEDDIFILSSESIRYGVNSKYLTTKCVTNKPLSRQDKTRAKKKKRRHPNYSNLHGNYHNQPTYKPSNIIQKNLQRINVTIPQLARGNWWTRGAPVRGRSSAPAFTAAGYVHTTNSNVNNFIPNSCINRWSYRGVPLLQPWSLEGNKTATETKPCGDHLTQDSMKGEEEEGEAEDGHDSVIRFPRADSRHPKCIICRG